MGQNTFVQDRPVRNAGDVPITPAGGISATTVQAAIEELDTEKMAKASNLSDVANAATAFGNIKQSATDAVTGVMLKSTNAKTITGTDTDSAVTPATLSAKLPNGAVSGDILVWNGTTYSAVNLYSLVSGLTWNESTDIYTRTGALAGFPLGVTPGDYWLPIHKLMKRCVVSDAGVIQYYLSPTDSTKKADGSAAVLDGTNGQVMVYVPAFYYRYAYLNNLHSWEISPVPLDGFSLHPAFQNDGVTKSYRLYGAYEGYKDGSNKLCSISGVLPTVSVTRANFRTYAAARGDGWRQEEAYLDAAVHLLYAIEYADFDTQAFIGQGISQYSVWPGGPQALTGNSNAVGNATNKSDAAVPTWAATTAKTLGQMVTPTVANNYTYQCTTQGTTDGSQPTWPTTIGATVTDGTVVWTCVRIGLYMSYRGIENWYGHVWKFVDGINIHNSTANRSRLYLCNNRASFADDTDSGYTLIGLLAETDGYFKTLIQTGVGFYPAGVGGGSATYLADYYYTYFNDNPDIGWRVALRGGHALNGAYAGAFYFTSSDSAASAVSNFGGRLCL